MLLIILIIAVAVCFILYDHFTNTNDYWVVRNVRGPKPIFFFGNIKEFVLKKKSQGEIYKEICDQYPEEKMVGIFRTKTPVLLIKDADYVKNILVKEFSAFSERGLLLNERDLESNLFNATGDTWRVLRSRLTSIFSQANLKSMMSIMLNRGDKFMDYVNQVTEVQTEQEVNSLFKRFLLTKNISACAFGIEVGSYAKLRSMLTYLEDYMFTHNYTSMLEIMYPGALKKIGGSPLPKAATNYFVRLAKHLIAQKDAGTTYSNSYVNSLMQLAGVNDLSQSGKENVKPENSMGMLEDMLSAQSFVFFAAGYESNTAVTGFILYHLALNPSIQDKAKAEIIDVLQKYDGKLTYRAVADLKYLDQILHETLRMHPPVDAIKRCAQKDWLLPGTDLTIQKGQIIIVPVNVIHMDEKYYPNPEVFDPERFSAENRASIYPGAYLPFGLGQRQCVGYRFSEIQIKVFMVKLLMQFNIEPTKKTPEPRNIKLDPNRFFQYPVGGIHLNLIEKV